MRQVAGNCTSHNPSGLQQAISAFLASPVVAPRTSAGLLQLAKRAGRLWVKDRASAVFCNLCRAEAELWFRHEGPF